MCVPWGAGIQRSVFLTGKLQAERRTGQCNALNSLQELFTVRVSGAMRGCLSGTSVPQVTSSFVGHTPHVSLPERHLLPTCLSPCCSRCSSPSLLPTDTQELPQRLPRCGTPLLLPLLPPEHQLAAIISFGLWRLEGVSPVPKLKAPRSRHVLFRHPAGGWLN